MLFDSILPTVAAAAAKSLQLCLTLCNPIHGSPPGSCVPGVFQARILDWVAISFSMEAAGGGKRGRRLGFAWVELEMAVRFWEHDWELRREFWARDPNMGVVGTEMVFKASGWNFALLIASPICRHRWANYQCMEEDKESNQPIMVSGNHILPPILINPHSPWASCKHTNKPKRKWVNLLISCSQYIEIWRGEMN